MKHIHLLGSIPDIYINCSKNRPFANNKAIYVTGLSGSGKSYLAARISAKYEAELIHLDWLKHEKYAKGDAKIFLEKFKKEFPETIAFIQNKWNNSKRDDRNEIYIKYMNLFHSFVLDNLNENKLYIIEGVQIFSLLDISTLNSMSIIVKGSSSFKSLKNRYFRDYKSVNKNSLSAIIKFHIRVFKELFIFQLAHRILLNNFLKKVLQVKK